MKVRGAPAIAAAAAYGVALEARLAAHDAMNAGNQDAFSSRLDTCLEMLAQTRPTAVNLFWAIAEMSAVLAKTVANQPGERAMALEERAIAIAHADVASNMRIGEHGTSLFADKQAVQILTHCNTGSLATVGYGTAIGMIRALHEKAQLSHVWVDETRPFLQGARLTTYELKTLGIAHTLITDSMAAFFMQKGVVDAVVVGADRVAINGDTANKIGTYSLAVLADYHKIPFYVAAPLTTFDATKQTGDEIAIEERSSEEVTHFADLPVAPIGTKAAHPAFDVTPAKLITAIVTDEGIIVGPNDKRVREHLRLNGGLER